MIASDFKCAEIVKKLLKHNAEMFFTDCEGNSAISLAHKRGHENIVQILKNEGNYISFLQKYTLSLFSLDKKHCAHLLAMFLIDAGNRLRSLRVDLGICILLRWIQVLGCMLNYKFFRSVGVDANKLLPKQKQKTMVTQPSI